MTIIPKKLGLAKEKIKELLKDTDAGVGYRFNSPSDIAVVVHLSEPNCIEIPDTIDNIKVEVIITGKAYPQ